MASATTACRAARNKILTLRHTEKRDDQSTFGFFPLNKLREFLTEEKAAEILGCRCSQCEEDCKAFEQQLDPLRDLRRIIGEDDPETLRTTSNTAFSLFSLLIFVGHPIFIVGFVQRERFDYSLELFPEYFKEADLETYTGNYAHNNPIEFANFAFQFTSFMPQFAVRHMNSGQFSHYPAFTILPFIHEREIGKQMDQDSGEWTNIGANGRVFAFEIHEEYRNFLHAKKIKKFARKKIETTTFTAYLEKANLERSQSFNDKHIVKLIKAYSLGGVMNLIFPLAKTNLDELLRDSKWNYATNVQLEDDEAWKQLLGISRALSKIAGVPSKVSSPSSHRDSGAAKWFGFHFDLKPANILIEDDGTWLITDFGQATFTYSTSATPRVAHGGGTDAYAPPEIDNLEEQFRRRYDVWSLGCIFLEVTTFLILGYDGLKGCVDFEGLDQARREKDGWSRGPPDARFFYRTEKGGQYRVKQAILNFMEGLKKQVEIRGQQTQKFIEEILELIRQMLQVDPEDRLDIGEVIRILDDIIVRATSTDNQGEPLQIGPGPNEISVGAPELGMIKLSHLNEDTRQWQPASLQVFEDLKSNLRFNSLATPSRYVTKQYMRRDKDQIIPHYAFFHRERSQAHEPWITFANMHVSEIPGAIYSFSATADAHAVQSRLTYQKVEMSFPLASVRVKKYVKVSRRAWTGITKIFTKAPTEEAFEQSLKEGTDLGPANVHLWTEQEDQAANKRRETRSESTGSASTKRKPRVLHQHQTDYRPIYPRRVVIYLHNHGCILTVRTNINWIARVVDNSRKIQFKPTDPDRDAHFIVSVLRPIMGTQTAGLPLCPQILGRLEEQSRFEVDLCDLVFTNDMDHTLFNNKYREMKKEWLELKKEVEKQQGPTPVFGPPDPHGDPEFNAQVGQKPEPSLAHGDHAPTIPLWDFVEGIPPPSDGVKRNVVDRSRRRAAELPSFQLNDAPAPLDRSDTFPPAPPPPPNLRKSTTNRERRISHGGGGRTQPPRAFPKKSSRKASSSSNNRETEGGA
ncbi:hypothetical protein BCR34DRAFT_590512 [Clohesyomyces aquaticus]|uniref:Protein kinase domain-containing protein n=1 Tax=Clohesyomyces aquaticus TaxID=1231657 RepID=A0A1Y1Z921_9PLEO|nr:hypothetical protein BCR34DRAFT_590512 [Clohesyomyces aquaticus]